MADILITVTEEIAAGGYASAAQAAANAAEASKQAAQAAKNAAEVAELNAESAETNAEAAQVLAQSAEVTATAKAGEATVAADQAVAAKNEAVTAKDAAVLAQGAAEAAKTDAEAANTSAQNAKIDAEASKLAAQAAETGVSEDAEAAANAASQAEGFKTEAAGSASQAAGSANTATIKANTATVKAAEAAQSATDAANSASTANSNAQVATTKASEANVSAGAASAAKIAAEAARDASVIAKDAAVVAKTAAETANTNAQAAKTSAETAATTATTKASEASASANAISTGYPLIPFKNRVATDSGTIRDMTIVEKLYRENLQLLGNTVLLINGNTVKTRTSGSNVFVTKAYDNSTNNNDAVQATEVNQPFYAGNIAPNEVGKLKNISTTGRFETLASAITRADAQPWAISFVVTPDGLQTDFGGIIGNNSSGASNIIGISNGNVLFRNSAGTNYQFYIVGNFGYNNLIGKNNIYTLQTTGSGDLTLFINGIPKETKTGCVTSFSFDTILKTGSLASRSFTGTLSHAQIFNKALSAYEVQQHHTYLRSIYPEIEGVAIGNQYIGTSNYEGVVAGDGSVIGEMQAATDTEMVVGGNFEGGLVGSLTSGTEISTWTLNNVAPISGTQDGRLQVTTIGTNANRPLISFPASRVSGEWRKLSFNYKVNSGICRLDAIHKGGTTYDINQVLSGSGTINYYYKTDGITALNLYFDGRNLFDIQIDNVSDLKYGWSGAQSLYDGIYAQTTGTAAVKDLAATKASSFWCFYNNDPLNGAIYGKLYNWWAVKLISLYQPKGWRVPTSADFTQLQTYLGGSTVAGGKVKAKYGVFDNAFATNESGLSIIANGIRLQNGVFQGIATDGYIWDTSATGEKLNVYAPDTVLYLTANDKGRGCGIRLMRNEPVGPNERMETSGRFTTDIASAAKQIPISFGYSVRCLRIAADTALTNVEVKLFNAAGTVIATLITGKSISAGATVVYNLTAEHEAMLQDGTVRTTATGNGGTLGMNIDVVLDKTTLS